MAKDQAHVDNTCKGDHCPAYSISQVLHTLIGLCIMLFGRYIPAPSLSVEASQRLIDLGFPIIDNSAIVSISPSGMLALSLFIGVVYLWSTVDTFWPSVLSIILVGMSEFGPMNKTLATFLYNPLIIYLLFLFLFTAALIHSNISVYLARWMMTRPILQGRPWLLTGAMLLTCYVAAFLEQVSAVFLMWPVLYVFFDMAGYKKGDAYVSFMMANSIMAIMLSFASDPIKGGAFYVLSNLYNVAATSPELHAEPINFGLYLIFSVTTSLVALACILASMRYIFRVDVSKLANINVEEFNRHPLPPMTWRQKGVIVVFFIFVAWMLMPSILGSDNAIGKFFTDNMMAGTAIAVFLLSFINYKSKSIANLKDFAPKFPWGVYVLIAVAYFLCGIMLLPSTNVVIFMEYVLRTWLEGTSYVVLVASVCCLGLVLTNICNSVACGLLFTPVLLAMCNALEVSASPLLVCFFFITMIASLTPAGSPYAALMYENKEWISFKDAFKYSAASSAIVLIVLLCIGLPMATMIF